MDTNKLIRDFKVAMQKGKQFTISTLTEVSEFTCYMIEGSTTLKLRTSTGSERYTTFKNIERYFKNEVIKDEKHYVVAICEWLENTDLQKDIRFNFKEIKDTLKVFANNYEQYLEDGKNGYYYNIFIEANIAGQEIRHSKYLANLFNQNSNHFHGNLFFKNFIEELKLYENLNNCDVIINFNIDNYSIITEEYDNENEEKKGFMDIVIRDKQYMIIIENKTGTKDHLGQLIRYKDYAQNKKNNGEIKDYIILYLTPDGEDPTDNEAKNDEKIVSISYIWDIRNCMINSKESIQNEILSDIIQQYIDSIPLYVYKLPVNWEYELNTLQIITKDLNIFTQCSNITNIVNNNIIQENNIFTNEEISIARWITKYFIKSKAMIERNFMLELKDMLDNSLEKDGFMFSNNSNILVNDFQDNINIDINFDVNTIYEKRKNRTSSIIKNDIDSIRENTGESIIYFNKISENESLLMTILIDIYGINVYFNHIEDEGCINNFEGKHIEVLSADVFHSLNINKLLDEEYTQKLIKKCKTKILSGLKQIEI